MCDGDWKKDMFAAQDGSPWPYAAYALLLVYGGLFGNPGGFLAVYVLNVTPHIFSGRVNSLYEWGSMRP